MFARIREEVVGIRRIVFRMFEWFRSLVTDRDKRLILLSAIMFSAGFAPLPFGFLAYICLVPLFFVAKDKGFKRGFRLGYLFGFELSVFALYWVISFAFNSSQRITLINPTFTASVYGLFCFLGMTVLHSLFYAALFSLFCWLYRRHRVLIISFPFIWTAVEYLRTMSQFAFPWTNLSYTQSYYLPLIQSADIWGDIGLSFWIAVINLLVFLAWKRRREIRHAIAPAAAVLLLFAAALVYNSTTDEYEANIDVALLQGHFPLQVKWDRSMREYNIEVYDSLTREAHDHGADLIVWPETAAPMYLRHELKYYDWVRSLAIELQTYVLVGTLIYEDLPGDRPRYYNGCHQFTPFGETQVPYKKTELVPFSERVPYADYFPAIKNVHLGQSDFSPGDSLLLFEHPKGNYATLICFELAFSDLCRRFANNGADFFLTITNDTWFGKTAGPYQHMQMAPFRAIENRTWIARCANSGFTFTVDPNGRKYGRSNLGERTIVYGKIGTIAERTFFTKHGLWLPKLCMIATFLFLFAGLVVKLTRK